MYEVKRMHREMEKTLKKIEEEKNKKLRKIPDKNKIDLYYIVIAVIILTSFPFVVTSAVALLPTALIPAYGGTLIGTIFLVLFLRKFIFKYYERKFKRVKEYYDKLYDKVKKEYEKIISELSKVKSAEYFYCMADLTKYCLLDVLGFADDLANALKEFVEEGRVLGIREVLDRVGWATSRCPWKCRYSVDEPRYGHVKVFEWVKEVWDAIYYDDIDKLKKLAEEMRPKIKDRYFREKLVLYSDLPIKTDFYLRLLEFHYFLAESVIRGQGVRLVKARAVVATVSGSGPGLGSVRSLLSRGLSGVITGFGCSGGSFDAKLPVGVAPAGFDGAWSYCRLGCGGWGCAYLCSRGGERAVFKVPRGFESVIEGGLAPTVDERLLKKIVSEAEVVASLKHPNVLRLLSYSRRAPILVYEFADGGSLEWQLARGWRPSLRDVVLIGIQVGDALRYIHSRGLVHGDVKPGNVFIVGGVAKVGDFSSLVRLVTMSSRFSRFAYTLGFRAPEQAYADLRREAASMGVESRIDTYQLGNLLLYLLTGDALDGEDAVKPGAVEEAVKKVRHPGLREVIRRALTPNPLERPSVEEIVRELFRIWKELGK